MTDIVERLRWMADQWNGGEEWLQVRKTVVPDLRGATDEIERLRRRAERAEAILRQCDEAMMWDVGGEPLPTLMVRAREAIEAHFNEVQP